MQSDDVKKVRDAVEMLKRRMELRSSMLDLITDGKLKASINNVTHAPQLSKKMGRIGWMLFWIPEPTMISTAVGIPLILAGKALDRYYNSLTVKGLYEETGRMLKSLEMLRSG
ncbi:MAG: hypothetical protein NZ888_06140 [Candidatus Nitrosocaldus sp.]|nr:hypothetical protein [Candidatus Nitrosocaldus sp.]MDW8000828.1 hypothetical protein [Candidatus Nitrosocaldus sp.]